MFTELIISLGALAAIFILFLVISRTLNSIVNLLTKMEYLVQKEYDFRKEAIEIQKLLIDEQRREAKAAADAEAAELRAATTPSSSKK